MKVFLLRHAIAVPRGAGRARTDRRRPLTPKGRRRLRQVIQAMARLGLQFDLIVSSPFVRARQTAELVVSELPSSAPLELSDTLAVGRHPRQVLDLLAKRRPAPASVLLVGHEPLLSQVASVLLCGDLGLRLQLKKAGLCKLRVSSLAGGQRATLEWLLTPKQLRQLA
jgi:phosphohistidine phosphatase